MMKPVLVARKAHRMLDLAVINSEMEQQYIRNITQDGDWWIGKYILYYDLIKNWYHGMKLGLVASQHTRWRLGCY